MAEESWNALSCALWTQTSHSAVSSFPCFVSLIPSLFPYKTYSLDSDLLKLVLVHTLAWVPVRVGSTFPPLSAEDPHSSSKSHPVPEFIAQDVIYFWDVFLDLSFIIFSKYSAAIIPKLFFSRPIAFSGVGKEALSFSGKRENIPLVSVFVSLTDSSVGSKKLSSG